MSYGYRYDMPGSPKRRRSGMGCLAVLTVLVLLLVGIGVLLVVFVRPQISKQAGTAIGNQLEQQISNQIRARVGEGAEIPPDFEGTVIITEDEVNQYIAENPDEIGPADSVNVRFLPGEVIADLTAYGQSGQARSGLAVQDGRVVATNPTMDGTLGFLLDAEQLTGALEDALNGELAGQGQQVREIEIQDGAIVATTGPTP